MADLSVLTDLSIDIDLYLEEYIYDFFLEEEGVECDYLLTHKIDFTVNGTHVCNERSNDIVRVTEDYIHLRFKSCDYTLAKEDLLVLLMLKGVG